MIDLLKIIKRKIQEWKINRWNPYCELCTSCGEEGCCSPISCMFKCMVDKRPKKCHYGSGYSEDLWFAYLLSDMYQKYTYKLKEKEITTEEYLEITEKEWHEIYDIAYAESIKRNREYSEKCNCNK
jgi:hypothetical protein